MGAMVVEVGPEIEQFILESGGSACNKVMFVHRETAASRKASTFAL
jgi:hypothetical protein